MMKPYEVERSRVEQSPGHAWIRASLVAKSKRVPSPCSKREALIRGIVAKTSVEGGVRIEASNDQLKRLAHPDIATNVSEILLDPATPEEGLLILLRLVREGPLPNCVPEALTLAANPHSSSNVVIYATAAIASAGNTEEKTQFITDLLLRPEIEERISCEVVSELYPDILSADELISLAEKTRPNDRMTAPDFEGTSTRNIAEGLPEDHLESLLDGFIALLNLRPGVTVDGKGTSYLVSRDHIWLVPILRAVFSQAFCSNDHWGKSRGKNCRGSLLDRTGRGNQTSLRKPKGRSSTGP